MEMLQVTNGKITDCTGKVIQLRGTCVGGWMNMENFVNGYPGSEDGMRCTLRDVLGASKAEFFLNSMMDKMLGEADIRFIKESGASVVRLALNYRHFESDQKPFEYMEAGFARLDKILNFCEKHDLYAILDLHAVQGWQNNDWHCDNDSGHTYFWAHPHFQDRFIALWKEFAKRYKNRAVVAGYDLMNEPACNACRGRFTGIDKYPRNWDRINGVFHRAVEAIRSIDPDHIIFLEGDHYAALFEGLETPFSNNLVYSSHNYIDAGFGPGPYPGSIKGIYWDKEKQREIFLSHEGSVFTRKHSVPLWVGEFGAVYNGPSEEIGDRLRALDDQLTVFEEFGAHWTTWTYKDVGVMGWVTLNPDSDYMQLIAHELEAKRLLDTDPWMGWMPDTPARHMICELADYSVNTIDDNEIDRDAVCAFLKQWAMCGYIGSLIQPSYAKRFKGLSEHRLDQITDSFALENCRVNNGLLELVKKHTYI